MRCYEDPIDLFPFLQIEDSEIFQGTVNEGTKEQPLDVASSEAGGQPNTIVLENNLNLQDYQAAGQPHSGLIPLQTSLSIFSQFDASPPNTFLFDLPNLLDSNSPHQYPTPSPTPSNTPVVTPAVTPRSLTPVSSSPSSPRGAGSSRKVSSSSKHQDGEPKQKIPRHKRESHINAEHRRRCKIQVKLIPCLILREKFNVLSSVIESSVLVSWYRCLDDHKMNGGPVAGILCPRPVKDPADYFKRNGFKDLQKLVPGIKEVTSGGTKDSKALMLTKAVDFCREMRTGNKELEREAAQLREEMQALTAQINTHQSQLPPHGVEIPHASKPVPIEKMLDDYVHARTFSSWKFYIFGLMIRPLFESFNRVVSTSNLEDFYQSVMRWLEEHCSLVALRPAVFTALRHLSTKTSVMHSPEKLKEEALRETMESSLKITTTNSLSTPL